MRLASVPVFLFSLVLSLFSQTLVSTSELSRGQELRGITRMSGNEMVEFRLRILSVMPNSQPGEDGILAEILDPLFVETGVLAGMSGSPVYLGQRLVGSVAYTSTFLKKPIVGITPIHSMLRLIPYSLTNRPDPYSKSRNLYGMKPIQTPIAVSGGFWVSESLMGKIFPDQKFLFVPGAVAASNEAIPRTFAAGDAIGVNLVKGDLDLSAYGTVTWVSNDYVLAFGHPMDLAGKTRLPLHTAVIDAVVPSLSLSYKVGRLGPEVGSIIEDRSTAILGKMGEKARRVPFDVRIQSEIQERSFHYEIVDSQSTLAEFAPILMVNSFLRYESSSEESTLLYRFKIKTDYKDRDLDLYDTISVSQNGDSLMALAKTARNLLSYLSQNRFLPIQIKALELDIKLDNKIAYALIEDIVPEKDSYAPGDTVRAKITLRRYKGERFEKNLEFKIPSSVKPGLYPLIASSGYYFLTVDSSYSPDRYMPQNPERLFDILSLKVSSKTLSLWMYGNSDGLMVQGESYGRLPVFQKSLMESSRTANKGALVEFVSADSEMTEVIVGAAVENIQIEDKKFGDKKTSAGSEK